MVPDLLSRATTSKAEPLLEPPVAASLVGWLGIAPIHCSRMLPVLRTQRTPVPTDRSADAFQPTLAQALTVSQSPGPEGLAEQFAFRSRQVSSGATSAPAPGWRDGSSTWSMGSVGHAYGLLQTSYPRPPGAFGAIYGFLVWLIGPAFLVPAMRLMGRPSRGAGRTHCRIDHRTLRTAAWRPLSRRCSGRSGSGRRGR